MEKTATFNKPLGGEVRIDITQPHQVSYWARKWDVPPTKLVKAVQSIGNDSARILEETLKLVRM